MRERIQLRGRQIATQQDALAQMAFVMDGGSRPRSPAISFGVVPGAIRMFTDTVWFVCNAARAAVTKPE